MKIAILVLGRFLAKYGFIYLNKSLEKILFKWSKIRNTLDCYCNHLIK